MAKKKDTPAPAATDPGATTVAAAPTETAAAAPKVEKPAKVIQNDVTRPKAGTQTGDVWAIADELSAAAGAPATRKSVLEATKAKGINDATAATQYGRWCKFHGLNLKALNAEKAAAAAAAPAQSPDVTVQPAA
jgi:hypothetical protein